MKRLTAIVIFAAVLFAVQAVWAQKPSVITKLDGAAYVVRACRTHDWVAAWAQLNNGTYDLYVVNGENGVKQKVINERDPGGMCWIPNSSKLLYCKGYKSDKVSFTKVTYYLYDYETEERKKLIDVNDMLESYMIDPIAAEDGSKVFHMTIAGTREGDVPSFNIYDSAKNFMLPIPSKANIASGYDLSSDGSRLFWQMHDPDTENLFIVGWDFIKNGTGGYSDSYEYGASADPADDHALLKVQATANRAATLAASLSDPTLKLCTYDFNNVDSLYIQPLKLKADEEIITFDWKGRGDVIYALIEDTAGGDSDSESKSSYLIEEIDVITGARNQLLASRDPISFIDYSAHGKTYYFTAVDERGSREAVTSLIRLR